MTIAQQAPLSMEFFRQEYWSGLPFPSPGNLPDLGIELGSPALQADSLPPDPLGKPPGKWIHVYIYLLFFRFCFHIGHCRVLSIVSYAIYTVGLY